MCTTYLHRSSRFLEVKPKGANDEVGSLVIKFGNWMGIVYIGQSPISSFYCFIEDFSPRTMSKNHLCNLLILFLFPGCFHETSFGRRQF